MNFKQIGRVWTGFVRLSVGINGGIFLPADHLSTYQEGLAITLWLVFGKCPVRTLAETLDVLVSGAFTKLREGTTNFVMSLCLSARNYTAPTGRIFVTFDI